MDNRSNADKIIDAIRKAGKPLKPIQIAELSGVGDDVVRTTVRQMLLKKELEQPGYGLYSLPKKNDLESIHLQIPPYPHDAPESALRDALEQLPWACALTDEDWAFYFATDRYIRVFELEQYVPIEGRVIKEMMPDVQTEVGDMVERLLQAGKSYHAPEHQVWRRADGRTWEMLYSLYPWRYGDKRGTIIECRSIIVDGVERIPQTRYVQTGVQVDPPVKIGKSTYAETPKPPEHMRVESGTLEDKIISLVDLDAMKQLIDAGAGNVQEGFYSVFKRVHDGQVYKLTVKVDVERESGPRQSQSPKTTKGPPQTE